MGLGLKIISIFILIALSLGCVEPASKETIPLPTSNIIPQITTKLSTENVDDSVQKLEFRIQELEKKVADLEEINKYNGIMKQSTKNLIPKPPFQVNILFKKNLSYLFKENGEVEITKGDPIPRKASYTIFHNNNTIKIMTKNITLGFGTLEDFDYYWIRFFDDFAVSTYENGWIEWAAKYDIILDVASKWEKIK